MKKYKLIKEYPSSPKLGSVITDTNPVNGAKDGWFDINWCKAGVSSFKLGKDLNPENYPEFWEEVKEKWYCDILEDIRKCFESEYVRIESLLKNFNLNEKDL